MSAPRDVLELLLPGADGSALARAKAVVTFARLLASDASRTTPMPAGVALGPASQELEETSRHAVLEAIEDLLRAFLDAAAPIDSCAWFGPLRGSYASAWAALVDRRDEVSSLAGVPGPGEPPLGVAQRLLDEAARLDMSPHRLALWRARVQWLLEGPRSAETALAGLLATLDPPRIDSDVWAETLASAVEAFLDRGQVGRARALLMEHAAGPATRRIEALRAWCDLLATGVAPTVPRSAHPEEGPLPLPLFELRAHTPGFLTGLVGRGAEELRSGCVGRRPDPVLRLERAAIGASVLAVVAFRPSGGTRSAVLEAAPAIEQEVRRALAAREGGPPATEAEQRVVLEVEIQRAHASGPHPPRGAASASSRALVLVPIPDENAEVAGWLHLEFEHHALPADVRLRALARLAGTLLLRRAAHDEGAPGAILRSPVSGWLDLRCEPSACEPLAEAFHALVERCASKTAHRHWFGVVVEGESARLVAEGGALPWRPPAVCSARALRRVWASGRGWCFDAPERGMGLAPDAASGVVVPIRWRGECLGLLAIESNRRRDFRPADLERYVQACDEHALAMHLARLAEWHASRFGPSLLHEPEHARVRELAERVAVGGRTRHAALVSGPPGSGKLVLARWLHYESPARDMPLAVLGCATDTDLDALGRRLERGSVILDGLGSLGPLGQERLLECIEASARSGCEPARERSVRLLCILGARAGEPSAGAPQRADLLATLERWHYVVPSLAERRAEIPGLARHFLRRAAREEGLAESALADDALALLWRQSWPGNVRELEQVAHRLAVLHPGQSLAAEQVAALLARSGQEVLARLPSRHPRRTDLESALATTRTAGGRVNKTRAALYLGWDPDTLVARLAEAGLDGELADPADPEVAPGTA